MQSANKALKADWQHYFRCCSSKHEKNRNKAAEELLFGVERHYYSHVLAGGERDMEKYKQYMSDNDLGPRAVSVDPEIWEATIILAVEKVKHRAPAVSRPREYYYSFAPFFFSLFTTTTQSPGAAPRRSSSRRSARASPSPLRGTPSFRSPRTCGKPCGSWQKRLVKSSSSLLPCCSMPPAVSSWTSARWSPSFPTALSSPSRCSARCKTWS